MGATYEPQKTYGDYDAMLADPEVEAVIVATSDAFHVADVDPGAGGRQACAVRKANRRLGRRGARSSPHAVKRSGRVLQVGHMKRFDPGLEAARDFVRDEMGEMLALKAWYCDSTHRYTMTDAVQPLPVTSKRRQEAGRQSQGGPRGDISCWRTAATSSTRRASCAARSSRCSARLNEKIRRLLLVRRNRASPTARSAIST